MALRGNFPDARGGAGSCGASSSTTSASATAAATAAVAAAAEAAAEAAAAAADVSAAEASAEAAPAAPATAAPSVEDVFWSWAPSVFTTTTPAPTEPGPVFAPFAAPGEDADDGESSSPSAMVDRSMTPPAPPAPPAVAAAVEGGIVVDEVGGAACIMSCEDAGGKGCCPGSCCGQTPFICGMPGCAKPG